MDREEYDKAYAGIAIAHEILHEDVLRDAFRAQATLKKRGEYKSIGELLLQGEKIDRKHHLAVERAVKYRQQRKADKLLGQIMIVSEYAPEDEVKQGLVKQKKLYSETGETRTLGEILTEDDVIMPEHVYAARRIRKLKTGMG